MGTVNVLKSLTSNQTYRYEIIGQCRETQMMIKKAKLIAQSNAPVLLQGETGTGKELFARLIHNKSRRKSAPFITVNCSALTTHLVNSELFGHEKGSFSGAIKRKKGLFEQADGGTMFLDEIGDMDIALQSKILRALQEGEIQTVGGEKKIKVNVRIISATNKNLFKDMENGKFRDDLYYRINKLSIFLEPLRNRKSDIPVLVKHFIKKHQTNNCIGIKNNAYDLLFGYNWPGNIRELENAIEKALTMMDSQKTLLESSDFELPITWQKSTKFLSLKKHKKTSIDLYIIKVLIHTGFNKTNSAKILNINRPHFSKLCSDMLKRNDIKLDRSKKDYKIQEKKEFYKILEEIKRKNETP